MTTVHMLWLYGSLSRLEHLSVRSFLAQGFVVHLWSYDKLANVPPGTIRRNAREVMPESRVFRYRGTGSYAGFSNLFRYAVLRTHGGLWADTDVICLTDARSLPAEAFFVTERNKQGGLAVNTNVIHLPRPERGDIVDLAFAVADRMRPDVQEWGWCGPKLMTALVNMYKPIAPIVQPPDFANPVDYWDCPGKLLQPGLVVSSEARFLHCYNEMWRRGGTSKEHAFPEGSIMDQADRRFAAG